VVAVTQLALSVFELVPGSHDLHETSSAGIAIGVGALLAAWRPSRAGGVVSVVAAFAVLLVGTTVADVGRGEIPAVHELPHLLVLAEAALLALLARGRSPAPRRSGGTRLPLRRAA
jgi:predicted anti-sigma-YlaC factor YlaD